MPLTYNFDGRIKNGKLSQTKQNGGLAYGDHHSRGGSVGDPHGQEHCADHEP
jgi:hypothetical protein